MRLLALDTTKSKSYIYLIDNDKTDIKVLEETRKVSENLLTEIDLLLMKNKILLTDIDVLGAMIGPGSFTGVRISLATLKAFNKVLNKKLIKVNAFEPFADIVKNGVLFLFSTKTSVYYAIYKNSKIEDMGVASTDEIGIKFKDCDCYIIEENLKNMVNAKFINDYEACVLNEFKHKIAINEFVEEQDFAPLYLQLSQAELNLKRKEHDN